MGNVGMHGTIFFVLQRIGQNNEPKFSQINMAFATTRKRPESRGKLYQSMI
jgi:hypothetical protein